MRWFDINKIGETTFLVFANGMVPADNIAELRVDSSGVNICCRQGGWVIMKPPTSEPIIYEGFGAKKENANG